MMFLAACKFWVSLFPGLTKLGMASFSILGFAQVALAAPELPITKLPVVSGSEPYTGPTIDPFATFGQWFLNPITLQQFALPVQFYDNPAQPVNPVNGGGGFLGTSAIHGVVSSVTTVGGNITAFQIQASITYDMPALCPGPVESTRTTKH